MLMLLGVFMLISTHEMYKAMSAIGSKPARWTGYAFCILAIGAQSIMLLRPSLPDLSGMALLTGVLLAMCSLVLRGKIAVGNMMSTVFPMIYPGIFYMALMNLLRLENRAAVITALALAFFSASVNDVFALVVGLSIGKHKLSPELSPKKTIEGSIGGLVSCVLFSMAVPAILRLIFCKDAAFIAQSASLPPVWAFALLGLVAGALSQIGDLTASMIKRHCGVKDFGRLLPGHGGIMDRMDGVLFCGAACYIFFTIVGLG